VPANSRSAPALWPLGLFDAVGIQLNISDVRMVVDPADFQGYLALMQTLPRAAAQYYTVSAPAAVLLKPFRGSWIGWLMGLNWPDSEFMHACMHACMPRLMHLLGSAAVMQSCMPMSCKGIEGQRVSETQRGAEPFSSAALYYDTPSPCQPCMHACPG
jgi:hypothetical protein